MENSKDRFKNLRDKRPWQEISRENGYWAGYYRWKNGSITIMAENQYGKVIPITFVCRDA